MFKKLFTMLLLLGSWSQAQDEQIAALEASMKSELSTVNDSIWKMEAGYVKALKRLEPQIIKTGALDKVLILRKEITDFKTAGEHTFVDFPELTNLRTLYETSLKKKQAEVHRLRAGILKKYAGKFAEITKAQTQAGNLELAVKANNRKKQLTADAEAAMKASATGAVVLVEVKKGEFLWELKQKSDIRSVKDCDIEGEAGDWTLSSVQRAGTYVESDEKFKTPFEIITRGKTDSTNIRYYLGKQLIVIFNWEMNKNQLRIHNPVTNSKHAFNDQGYLSVDEMHDIRIVMGTEKMSVYSNGKLRGEVEGDFSKIEAPAGIGPAFGSNVTLEEFAVRAIEE